MNNLLRAPIFLITIVGIILFILYGQVANFYDQRNRQILVSQNQIEILRETFTRTWSRSPTEQEMEAQVDNYIKDEVFFKEAVALGLDKTDPAVKRRLRQLMEIMLDDNSNVYASEDQLRSYLNEHPEKFAMDPSVSFKHLYFANEDYQTAEELIPRLKDGSVDASSVDAKMIMIASSFENESKREVERTFGTQFATGLLELEPQSWQGPVQSAYGWHLVYISELNQGILPDLNDVWDEVEREWSFERKQSLQEEQYQEIRGRYEIIIENPEQK